MKFINPHFKSAAEKKIEQHQPAVVAWLQAQAANRIITLAELRAGLPTIAGDLSRQVVNGICANIGAEIVDPEDQQA
jgi:hypothetical protein